ncbi:MAG: hypothetical protein WC314_00065 [Vulcanimicrobiota bacterium]
MRADRRGLTLIEALVAGFLALLLGLVMVRMLGSGLSAHRKGAQSRDAQAGARNVVNLVVAELRSAAVPPLSEPVVISPVFWPGVWGAEQEGASTDLFYPREEQEAGEGLELDLATNRVIYVRMSESKVEPTGGPLDAFALVELLVPKDKPGTLERRIYPLVALGGALVQEQVEGADGAARDGWMVDLSLLEGQSPINSDIIYDAGKDARVSFRVGHRTFEPASDPGRTRYPQPFDPGVYRVDVAVAIGSNGEGALTSAWPRSEEWETLREETTELKIPSVRQN